MRAGLGGRGCEPTARSSISGKQLVHNVARRRGQARAARLAPACAVYFLLVTNGEPARGLLCNEDRIAHPASRASRAPLLRPDFLPEPQPSELQLGKLFPDFALQAVLLVLVLTFASAGKHP